MQALKLARIAAEAEALRLRYSARRTAVRVALGLTALGFLSGAIVFCHVAAWFRLSVSWGEPVAALILAGTDLLAAVVLALVAARSSAGRFEAEALALRKRALDQATRSLAFSALMTPLVPLATRLLRRR
jgi:hypothetical protein